MFASNMKNIKKQPDKKKKEEFECPACGQITETDEYTFEMRFYGNQAIYTPANLCDCGIYVLKKV